MCGPAPQVLTHTRFTHLFSHSTTVNLHDGSDLSTAASSSAPPPFFFSVPHWAHGPMSPLEPNVSFFLAHSVFGPICVPACVCIERAKRVWDLDFTSQDVWAGDSDERGAERRPLVHSLVEQLRKTTVLFVMLNLLKYWDSCLHTHTHTPTYRHAILTPVSAHWAWASYYFVIKLVLFPVASQGCFTCRLSSGGGHISGAEVVAHNTYAIWTKVIVRSDCTPEDSLCAQLSYPAARVWELHLTD